MYLSDPSLYFKGRSWIWLRRIICQGRGEKYVISLEKSRIKYRIVSEETQDDGSVMIKIIKQYNTSPVGNDLDEKNE